MDASPARASSDESPLRILLVDDNEDQTATLGALLQLAGHEVQSAGDGQAGMERARSFKPDVAILDIGLPDIDGYELARKFRSDPGLRNTFLIAQTGWGQASDRAAGIEAGFDIHLVKPVEFEFLKKVIRERRRET